MPLIKGQGGLGSIYKGVSGASAYRYTELRGEYSAEKQSREGAEEDGKADIRAQTWAETEREGGSSVEMSEKRVGGGQLPEQRP